MPDTPTLPWILAGGLLMASIALVGGLFVLLPERHLRRLLKPAVAFAAGSLLGGALFHMVPHALARSAGDGVGVMTWVVMGFTAFFALDQLIEWHHCHAVPSEQVRPLGPLLLIADGAHNFLGGLAIGAAFILDPRTGTAAWVAGALHELPQEIGDFGAIVHAGYSRRRALLYNFLSALTFPAGALVAWTMGGALDLEGLVALGAGSFIYIAAADLLPEVKRSESLSSTSVRFTAFALGAGALYAVRAAS